MECNQTEERKHAAIRAERHREHAGNRTHRPIERELAKDDEPAGMRKADRDRKSVV